MLATTRNIYLINQFPDFNAPGFDLQRYNSIFIDNNVIINARSSHVEYDKHWGPLSVKCAFNGREYYRSGNDTLAVDDDSFLIFNEGKEYSSYIRSEQVVESFTINFSPSFVAETIASLTKNDDTLVRDLAVEPGTKFHFTEKLYRHNETLSPLLGSLRTLSQSVDAQKERVYEIFYDVLQALLLSQKQIRSEIEKMSPARNTTKQEMYRRLNIAKDLMYSCYDQQLCLNDIATAACMQTHYFLRQFKKNFGITPHQYLTRRRLDVSRNLLKDKEKSVLEICLTIGFADPSSFSKLFKARFGVSPQQFKKSV